MADTTEQAEKTYRGNCHCGAFVYECQLPEIKTANECNCSICYKKGYLWQFPPAGIKFVKGDEKELRQYTFLTGKIVHKACRVPFGETGRSTDSTSVLWPLRLACLRPEYRSHYWGSQNCLKRA